jgi:hypothetical protein
MLIDVQRAGRLLGLLGNPVDLVREMLNVGHECWNPQDHPEWLLLEVESDIVVRKVQQEIAFAMMNPPEDKNAVMQLNMGEGKSSIIVPMVALALADRSQLVRVVVAKPQAKQMLQMLVSKVGGLVNRRVYHLPFSRALRLEASQARAIEEMCRECRRTGGILLMQPEHILSFQLMAIGSYIEGPGGASVGSALLRTQHFFNRYSRDIVDESDENFSVKFELVYTIGTQRPIELSPERWTFIQSVLGLVGRFAPEIKNQLPVSIEADERYPGQFPRTRILRTDARDMLIDRIARTICEKGLPGFAIGLQPAATRADILIYITRPELAPEEISRVEQGNFFTEVTRGPLLLLRGLLAVGILAFALSAKRWRVNYGVDATRDPNTRLAVPYRAKDNPSPCSEHSHPEVVIILTCLSYYYSGLNDDDLFLAFEHVLNSDQAEEEFQLWVKAAPNLKQGFRSLSGINIKDRVQCVTRIFPQIRYSKGTIDYFLTHIVFPKEMREFPHKLSASGWDIGQVKAHPTTGFSGTNDSRHVLPLSVKQLDLPEQKHTNALVLDYLLQPENSIRRMPQRGSSSSTRKTHRKRSTL